MDVSGQNDRRTKILSGQIVILAGHCPLTGRYFEPCIVYKTALRASAVIGDNSRTYFKMWFVRVFTILTKSKRLFARFTVQKEINHHRVMRLTDIQYLNRATVKEKKRILDIYLNVAGTGILLSLQNQKRLLAKR